MCSPYSRSAIRLVVSSRIAGQTTSILASNWTASSKCSKLSTSSSISRLCSASIRWVSAVSADGGARPSSRASVVAISAGSRTGATSMKATPSAKFPARSWAACRASRVLPVPPTPVRVTSREAPTAAATSARSRSRPISRVAGAGNGVGVTRGRGAAGWSGDTAGPSGIPEAGADIVRLAVTSSRISRRTVNGGADQAAAGMACRGTPARSSSA